MKKGLFGIFIFVGVLAAASVVAEDGTMPRTVGPSCDLNGDGQCDARDVSLFRAALGSCSGDANYSVQADTDIDGCVTEEDERLLFSNQLPQLLQERRDVREGFRATTQTERGEMRQDIQGVRSTAQDAMMEKRSMMRNAETREARQQILKDMQQIREQRHSDVMSLRKSFKDDLEERRAEMKAKLEVNRGLLREKLSSIRDERKKALVEKLDKHFEEIGNRMIDHFTKILDKFEDVLGKIDDRADKAETNGKDVSSVRTAIDEAHKLIQTARGLITAQAGKTYPINITTEDKLGPAVSSSRNALHNDLQKIRDAAHAARKGVGDAVRALSAIQGVDDESSNTAATTTPPTP